jgi:hypothetical protein
MDRFINTNTINHVFAIRQDNGSFVGTTKRHKSRSLHLSSSMSYCAAQMCAWMEAAARAVRVAVAGPALVAVPAWRLPSSRRARRLSGPMDLS